MTFENEITELGFELVGGRGGAQRYALRSHPYLQWWVTLFSDGTAELTWEFELGAYLATKGFHVSVQDELSLLLFPSGERRGPAEAEWLATEMERGLAALGSVDLTGKEPDGTQDR